MYELLPKYGVDLNSVIDDAVRDATYLVVSVQCVVWALKYSVLEYIIWSTDLRALA